MSHPTPAPGHSPTEAEFIEVQASEEFADLRKTFRGFVFPLFVAFIAWYVFYIVTAGLVTWGYVKFADNKLDPASEHIRAMMEGRAPATSTQKTEEV